MAHFGDFTNRERPATPRNVEDAPRAMRQQLIDLFFTLIEHLPPPPPMRTERLYEVICQSLGAQIAGNPYGGFRYATGRDIAAVEWPNVYNLISRLWIEYDRIGLRAQFQDGVNRILAANGSAWELHADGRLRRVLPVAAQEQVEAAFAELQDVRYTPARDFLTAASDAYNAHPRRDRDVCTNAFDAMEAVARERYGLRNAALDAVIDHVRRGGGFNPQILTVLENINTLRHRNFGHGVPFNFTTAEVDFIYLSCIAGILLFSRAP
jgi:hypothetical protein